MTTVPLISSEAINQEIDGAANTRMNTITMENAIDANVNPFIQSTVQRSFSAKLERVITRNLDRSVK